VSFLRSRGKPWGVSENFLKDQDVHIHIPEAATPKDGPSAGITLATALLSALVGKPVPGDVAMTGEITLRGHILPVGGLAEKLMAARRAGICKLYVPAANRPDWFDLTAELREGVDAVFVENIEEVWNDIFPEPAAKTASSRHGLRRISPRPS
jgi:ATP-dependent Lon protease